MELVSIIIAFGALIVSIIFGIYSSNVAISSRGIARRAYQDSRSTSLLDLDPNIKLASLLNFDHGGVPEFRIYNEGPVDAVQVSVQLVDLYFRDRDMNRQMSYNSADRWQIGRLIPFESFRIPIPAETLDRVANPKTDPLHYALELQIVYRRESDRKIYASRAVYFIDPDRNLVRENVHTINNQTYAELKAAAFEPVSEAKLWGDDRLHDDVEIYE